MIYGYSRVSTINQAKGNSIESQCKLLRAAGAEIIYKDSFTGTKISRPEFNKLLKVINKGDTLIVTKLDRIARSAINGNELIQELIDKGISVHVLNMGMMDNTPSGKLIRNVMLSFAEFERDMIVERTQEGKEIARKNPGYKEGRPQKFTKKQIDHALDLLNEYSYKQVSEMTGISIATLARKKRLIKKD